MAKKVSGRPAGLNVDGLVDIYSLSGCISSYFCDYVPHWKHNGYWLFNAPADIASIAAAISLDLADHRLFYYEVYEKQFDETANAWHTFAPEESFVTNVKAPLSKTLAGFDVVTFSQQTTPECSPLSCSYLANDLPVNSHCLLNSLDEAVRLVESGTFTNTEPGPFRIFAVYSFEP